MFSELPVLIYSLGKHNILLAYTKSGTQNSKILGEWEGMGVLKLSSILFLLILQPLGSRRRFY